MGLLVELDDECLFIRASSDVTVSIRGNTRMSSIMTVCANKHALKSQITVDDAYHEIIFELVFVLAGRVLR
ncbi:hypothetical protein MY1_1298 [Nitrosarchaeum koreense MY1]|uniref:Uncharacterized protein n=2 Tax=Nitrosarchaeum TaxID=1007082 RepID=F9CXU0_9ARCH|nr:hypothetical protein MY1_1298 [Nitrosarchaeum koreense MY1]